MTGLSADARAKGPVPAPTLRALAVRGSAWTIGGYAASQAFRLVSSLVLSRLLAPNEFGLMALANIFVQGLQMLSDLGVGPSIIQNKRGEEPAFLNTAWTLQIVRGFALWGLAAALAWPAAWMYGAPQLGAILPALGAGLAIAGFNSTSLITLRRRLSLGRVLARDLTGQVVGFITMCAVAAVWPTVWALVVGSLVFHTTMMLMSHKVAGHIRPRLGWDPSAAREIVRFGKWVFLSTALTFFAMQIDRLALGGLMTPVELGVYSIALMLVGMAKEATAKLGSLVLFPALSRKQDDPDGLVRSCLRARSALLWVCGAMLAAVAIAAPEFFRLLYDPRYWGAGATSQWLVILIWTTVLHTTADPALLASGKARALFVMNVIVVAGIVPAVVGYDAGGLPMFIGGLALARLAALGWVIHRAPARRKELLKQSVVATAGLAAYALAGIALVDWLGANAPRWAMLGVTAGLAAAPGLGAARVILRVWKSRKPAERSAAEARAAEEAASLNSGLTAT